MTNMFPLSQMRYFSCKMSNKEVMYSCRKFLYSPPPYTEGIGISWGGEKCIKRNWNFQRGGGVLEMISSVEEVWIFLGTVQCATVCFTNLLTNGL